MPSGPPLAKRVPTERTHHGHTFVDEYAWLRDRDDPDTMAYLEAENAWTEQHLAPTAALQAKLFEEIRSRIQETDLSVPVKRRGWWYYSRTEEGKQYGITCRKQASEADTRHAPAETAIEHVLLDQNVEAGDSEFFALGAMSVSPDSSLLAWSSDLAGAEVYELRFRDLVSGEDLLDVVPGTYYGSAWAADNRSYFYVKPDDAMRPYQLWRHTLGTAASDDVLVFQEDDERFYLGVGTTKDERFIILHVGSKVTDEIWYLDASDAAGAGSRVLARTPRRSLPHRHERRWRRRLQARRSAGRIPRTRALDGGRPPPARDHAVGRRRVHRSHRVVRAR